MKTGCIKYIILLCVIINTINLYSQSQDQNYIRTRTMLHETDQSKSIDVIQYYDGLGRPTQTVQKRITPSGKDLVSLQEYDSFGRESNSWLPAPNAGNGAFVADPRQIITNFYGDSRPYSEPKYEDSPLNRVLEQHAPGQNWDGKSVKTAYLTNNNSDLSCYLLKIGSSDKLTKDGNYASGELYVTKVEDENGNVSYEFKDKLGQLILSRQITSLTYPTGQVIITKFDTYYVYDNFGNLRYVLPPLLSDKFSASTQSMLDDNVSMKQYAYIYKYDHRNRCTSKKLPGCDWIKYVYDKADRLIFSQDGELRKKPTQPGISPQGRWLTNVSDALGRLVLTMETEYVSYENVVSAEYTGNDYFKGYMPKNLGFNWSTRQILTVNYYDNYEFLKLNEFKTLGLGYTADANYGTRHGSDTDLVSAKGLLTGTIQALSDGSGYIYTVFYYDERGRLIQTKKRNHLGLVESEYTAYNFTGQPTKVLKKTPLKATLTLIENDQFVGDLSEIEEAYNYTYDHAGRLKNVARNGVNIQSNIYNELGQLDSLKQADILQTNYTYNIRGWTKTLSESKTGFKQTLYYEDVATGKNYNGNISRMQYSYNGQNPIDFTYTYDGLNRLRDAKADVNGKETSESMYYDKHGNPIGINRIQEDRYIGYLNTSLDGNQLEYMYDDISSIVSGSVQYTGIGDECYFAYDANGSLTKDTGRGIATIKYNFLNLPEVIQFSNGNMTYYTYAADGTKLKTRHLTAKVGVVQPITNGEVRELAPGDILSTLETDYTGSIIHEDDLNENIAPTVRVMFDGGYDLYTTRKEGVMRITYKASNYYLKDYLGNNRDVVSSRGQVHPHTEYLPFGTPLKKGGDRFKYSGKEFDEMHGLNWYDFHARQYDPIFGRFTSMDPLAEKKPWMSPYTYCSNNPLIRIDPDGMWDWELFAKGAIQTLGGAAEMAVGGAAILAPEPTMVTKVLGGAAIVHGADNVATGLKNMLQQDSNTATQTALTEGSKALGASDATAQTIGKTGDAIIGIGLTAGAGVLKSTTKTETVYRVFGQDAKAEGFSWTNKNPTKVSNFRDKAGLPSGGQSGATNSAEFMIKGKVNSSDIIKKRTALPLDGNKGGISEYIINPKSVKITDFKVLKP